MQNYTIKSPKVELFLPPLLKIELHFKKQSGITKTVMPLYLNYWN